MSISLPKAQLIALCLSTFLYGFFFTLVLIATVVMLHKVTDDIRRQRTKILTVSYAMLVVATLHFIVGWVRGLYGFADQKRGSATAFYADISDPTHLLKLCFLRIQLALGDGLIIWRLYVVYNRRFVVIIPAIFLVTAYAVVGVVVIVTIARAPIGTDIFHVAKSWIIAYFSLVMVTNILLSGAIALQIFLTGYPQRGPMRRWPIIFVLVESCALYTFSIVAALGTFLSKSNGQYAAADSVVPMIGIAFTLIMLQICFHDSASHGPRSDVHTPSAARQRPDGCPFGGEDPKNPLRPIRMAVHVSKQTNTDLNTHHVDKAAAFDPSFDMDKSTMV